MAESSFTNFFNNSHSFGLNIKSHERTLQQLGKTAGDVAGGVFEPLFSYLEENENVFSGDLKKELNRKYVERFKMEAALSQAQGERPSFDTQF